MKKVEIKRGRSKGKEIASSVDDDNKNRNLIEAVERDATVNIWDDFRLKDNKTIWNIFEKTLPKIESYESIQSAQNRRK